MLSATSLLHSAFRETLDYRGKYAFVQQLLRDAERYLRAMSLPIREDSLGYFSIALST